MYWLGASKLATSDAVIFPSNSSAAVVCVGVEARKTSPVRGPISIVRSVIRVEAKPVTARIGPSSATRAVR